MKKKFNIIDLFVAVIFALAIALLYSYVVNAGISDSENSDKVKIEVTVQASGVKDDYLINIKSGDVAICADDGTVFGEITGIYVSDYYVKVYGEDDKFLIHPELKNLTVILSCDINNNGGYYISESKRIIVGEKYDLILPSAYLSAECTYVKLNDDRGGA